MYDMGERLKHREFVLDIVKSCGGSYVIRRPVGGIGDAVMLNPAITALRKDSDELIIVVCVDYIKAIFKTNDAISYILSYTEEEVQEGVEYQDVCKLEKCGSIIFDYYTPCPAAKYESDNSPYLISVHKQTIETGKRIAKSRQVIFCEHAGVEFDKNNYNMSLDGEHKEFTDSLGINGRYIAVQIRSHDEWRNYPKWKTKWLLNELVAFGRKHNFGIVTVDSTMTVDINGVHSLCGMGLDKTMAVIKKSIVGIGPDSMLVHIKGAFGGHSLALFGPTDPSVRLKYQNAHWMPRFDRCPRQYCWYTPCKNRYCMTAKAMNPRKIIDKLEMILQEADQ